MKIPEIASMEAYDVGVFAVSQNSYFMLDDVEVITYNNILQCIFCLLDINRVDEGIVSQHVLWVI